MRDAYPGAAKRVCKMPKFAFKSPAVRLGSKIFETMKGKFIWGAIIIGIVLRV